MNSIIHLAFGSTVCRAVKINERNWFFARDICECLDLDIEAGRNAVYQLDIDDRRVLDLADFGSFGKTTLVNESGLYLLMMENPWEEAREKFRKWVISEALPSLNAADPKPPAQEPDVDVVVSSHDLATLMKRRPNNLKRTIERLVVKGKISQPTTGHQMVADSRGRTRSHAIYLLSHRDASYVAAHLDPARTWIPLPNANSAPAADPAPVTAPAPAEDEQVIEATPPAPAPTPSLFDHAQSGFAFDARASLERAQSKAPPSVTGSEPTMSSREIAGLVEKRHDNVLRDIKEMLEEINDLRFEAVDFEHDYKDRKGEHRKEYRLPKDLTITLITGYRADLRYKVVKRLEELEAKPAATPAEPAATSLPNFTDPADAARAWASEYEKREKAENELAKAETIAISMTRDSEALNRFSNADGSLVVTDTAKMLKVLPGYLFELMSKEGWTYRRGRSGTWHGYQEKVTAGYLKNVGTDILMPDGSTKIGYQVRVTAKGIAKLAKIIEEKESARRVDSLNAAIGGRA